MTLRSALLLTALSVAVAAGGCASSADGADPDPGPGSTDDPGDPGTPGDPGDPTQDPGLCVGDGGDGEVCEVTADCDAPLVCLSNICVGPQDPDVFCDEVEGIFCAGTDEVCVANACVIDPNITGDPTCSDPGPGPELAGVWDMDSTLHLREGLPGLVAGLLDVSELLADFIDGNVSLGLPAPVEILIGALVQGVIDQYVPVWAQDLIQLLAGFSDVLDDLRVDQTVTLVGQVCEANYRGSSTWDRITFEYRGTVISERPEDIAEIGPVAPEDFGARYSCGQLFIDRHRVHNALRGLIRWMVDTLVEVATGYPTLEGAIDAAVDCPSIARGINDAWQGAGGGTDITGVVEAACANFETDLLAQLTTILDEAAIELSVVSFEGVADIPDGSRMINGRWFGELVSNDFPGQFTAAKQ